MRRSLEDSRMPTPITYLPYSLSLSTSDEKSESPESRMNVPISGRVKTSSRASTARRMSVAFFLFDIRLARSEEHTSELQSRLHLVCRLLLEKKKIINKYYIVV